MTAEKEIDSKGEKKKSLLAQQQQQQQQPIRNQAPPFMSGGNLSQMDRLKMAQSDSIDARHETIRYSLQSNDYAKQSSSSEHDEFWVLTAAATSEDEHSEGTILATTANDADEKQQLDNPVLSQFMQQQQQCALAQSQFRAQFQQQQLMNFPMMQQQQRDVKSDESSKSFLSMIILIL